VTDNHFHLILLILIIHRIITYPYQNKYISSLFNLFGTFLHEMAHLLISLLLNGKPVSFSILPYKEEDKISFSKKLMNWIKLKFFGIKTVYSQDLILGGVGHSNLRWYNSFLIGLAPLLLIPFAYYLNIYLADTLEPTYLNQFLTLFFIITIVVNAIPSKSDIDIAFSYKIASLVHFLLLISIIFAILNKV